MHMHVSMTHGIARSARHIITIIMYNNTAAKMQ